MMGRCTRQAVLKFGWGFDSTRGLPRGAGLPFFEHLIHDLRYALSHVCQIAGLSAICDSDRAFGHERRRGFSASVVYARCCCITPAALPHPEELLRI